MTQVPAITGWHWIKQGTALFRKQPLEISTMFLGYMFLTVAGGIIPVLGQILPLLLVPVFSMSFMQACVQLESGKRIFPNLLVSGFRLPAFRSLLLPPSSKRNSHAQEGCRNRGGVLARTFVLAIEKVFKLLLQISGSTVLFCGFKRIHSRPVKFLE